jgi:hypothetical protein
MKASINSEMHYQMMVPLFLETEARKRMEKIKSMLNLLLIGKVMSKMRACLHHHQKKI